MNAEERVANTLQARLSWPQAEACAADAISSLRTDPEAVRSLLPDDLLADIWVAAVLAVRFGAYFACDHSEADRVLAWLGEQ